MNGYGSNGYQTPERSGPRYTGQTGGHPPQTSGYPGQTGGYPPRTDGMPGQTGEYPPQTGNRPGQTVGYPHGPDSQSGQTVGYPQRTDAYPLRTGGQEPVRDWQKNTWFGPAPENGNPFDEPEDAPELLEERSENLKDRENGFWAQKTDGYQYGSQGTARQPEPEKKEKPEKKAVLPKVIAVLIAAAAVFIVLRFVFSVKRITVTGTTEYSADEVIRLSGIRTGTPILSVDGDAVGWKIENESNYKLQFRYMEKKLPGDILIAVRERTPCCWMYWCGIMYVMDKHLVVLYETEDENPPVPSQLVEMSGLSVRSGCMVGQTLTLESAEQESVFSELFVQMRVLNCTADILHADLSNLYSIMLTTRSGFTVVLGDRSDLHAKMRSMLLTIDKLISMGYSDGTVNVVNPTNPVFSPSPVSP